ncbi:MAG: serine/threonine protein kinase [Myxococcales bacterium]|nr:serine/threonine protein kinase [Myxococcales bacterium]
MGEVWLAKHEDLLTDVAIKFALDREMEDRFRFEAQVSAQLGQRTAHVVRVHDSGRHGGVSFLVMDYVEGRSLEDVLQAETRLSDRTLVALAHQLANALDVAHAAGIWHRDLKPANVMVQERDGELSAKLADFGVAKALDTALEVDLPRTTSTGTLVGSPAYVSPEQIGGEAPAASSDRWSLAVLLYEALTGRLPFDAPTLSQLLIAIAGKAHVPPSAIEPRWVSLDAFFDRALHKEPAQRFESAGSLARAFEQAIGEVGVGATTMPEAEIPWLRSRRPVWLAVAAGAIMVAGGGAWLAEARTPLVAESWPPPAPTLASDTEVPVVEEPAPEPVPPESTAKAKAPAPAQVPTPSPRPRRPLDPSEVL